VPSHFSLCYNNRGQLIYGTGRSPSLSGVNKWSENDYWSFDQDLEGVRSVRAALDDGDFVCPGEGRCPTLRVALSCVEFRGCKGLQPFKVRNGSLAKT